MGIRSSRSHGRVRWAIDPPVWLWPKLRRHVLRRAAGRCECDLSCGRHAGRCTVVVDGPGSLAFVRGPEGILAICPACRAALRSSSRR